MGFKLIRQSFIKKVVNIVCGSDGKASAYNVGDLGLIPGSGRFPGEGNGNPRQYSSWKIPWTEELGEGYCPWGRTESDTTEET